MLDDAVIDDGQRLAVAGGKYHDNAAEGSRLDAIFFHRLSLRPFEHVGLHADGESFEASGGSFHGAPAIHQLRVIVGHEQVVTAAVDCAFIDEIAIAGFQCGHATLHVENLLDGLIVDQQHEASCQVQGISFLYFAEAVTMQGQSRLYA
jgi:hypothetical protein